MSSEMVSNPTYFHLELNGIEHLDLQNCVEQYQLTNNENLLSIILYKLRATIRYYLYKRTNCYDKAELLALFEDKLLECLKTYDASKGVKFITYFSRCLDNVLINYNKKNERNSAYSITMLVNDDGEDSSVEYDIPYEDRYGDVDSYLLLMQLKPRLQNNEYKVCEAILSDPHILKKTEIAEMVGLTPMAICNILRNLQKRFKDFQRIGIL